jgi:hypothetical protein
VAGIAVLWLVCAWRARARVRSQPRARALSVLTRAWRAPQATALVPAAAAVAADDTDVASSRMSYSRFLVRAASTRAAAGSGSSEPRNHKGAP